MVTRDQYESFDNRPDAREAAGEYVEGLRTHIRDTIDAGAELVRATIERDTNPPLASREAILSISDLVVEEMFIPEWNVRVRIKGLTAKERDAYEQSLTVGKGANQSLNMQNARARLAVMTMVGADNQPLFSRSDVEALGRKSAIALERIFDRARRLSGLTNEDMDELTGN